MDEKNTAMPAEIPRLCRHARALLCDTDAATILFRRELTWLDNRRAGKHLRRWLVTIMHHLFVDQTRKVNRRGKVPTLPQEAAEGVAAPGLLADGYTVRNLLDALEAINPERRTAIVWSR